MRDFLERDQVTARDWLLVPLAPGVAVPCGERLCDTCTWLHALRWAPEPSQSERTTCAGECHA